MIKIIFLMIFIMIILMPAASVFEKRVLKGKAGEYQSEQKTFTEKENLQ